MASLPVTFLVTQLYRNSPFLQWKATSPHPRLWLWLWLRRNAHMGWGTCLQGVCYICMWQFNAFENQWSSFTPPASTFSSSLLSPWKSHLYFPCPIESAAYLTGPSDTSSILMQGTKWWISSNLVLCEIKMSPLSTQTSWKMQKALVCNTILKMPSLWDQGVNAAAMSFLCHLVPQIKVHFNQTFYHFLIANISLIPVGVFDINYSVEGLHYQFS